MRRIWRRAVSLVLTLSLMLSLIPAVHAEAVDVYLPEAQIGEDIAQSDVFYLATPMAQVQEGRDERYLIRLARGGPADSEAGVEVRIADLTAKYGKDYTITLVGGGAQVDNPKENQSLLERMKGSEYTESPIITNEELEEKMAEDPALKEQMTQAVQEAIDYLEEASGLKDAETPEAPEEPTETPEEPAETPEEPVETPEEPAETPEEPVETPEESAETPEEPVETAEEPAETAEEPAEAPEEPTEMPEKPTPTPEDAEAVPAETEEYVNTNPLQEARALFTGIEGEPQRVTSSGDMLQDIQKMANVITNAVVGATLTVPFAAGETEKYLAINVKDNFTGDGDRYFYLILGAPYGSTTNSAASTCAVTILDDEEQKPSEVFFSASHYDAEGESVTVEIRRTGALNSNVTAQLTTADSTDAGTTAQAGRDFSPVDMEIAFPMGIDTRRIQIPVQTGYLRQDAEFALDLTATTACTVSRGRASVTIHAAGEDQAELLATEEFRVSDIVLGSPISLKNPVKSGNTDHFGGTNQYDANGNNGKGQWVIKWKDNYSGWQHFWGSSANGYAGASWNILPDANNHGAHFAGVQVDWSRQGSDANLEGVFIGSGSQDLPYNYYNSGGEEMPYSSRSSFSNHTETNIFCPYWDPARITIWNTSNCNDCDTVWIYSITPILRPFEIHLNNGPAMNFLTETGAKSAWSGATFLALGGANNNDNQNIIRYSAAGKNSIEFKQTIGGNVATPYVYLKNVSITKDGSSKKLFANDLTDDAKTSHTFTLNENAIDTLRSYITFPKNNSSDAWKNQSGQFGVKGHIELTPEFGYKDAKVKIIVPSTNYGYFRISGSSKNYSSTTTLTYHRGDVLKLSTVMRTDAISKLYEPAGFRIRCKVNESDTKWVRDGIVNYQNGSAFLDTNERLQYGYYEITPLFQKTGNSISVRVRKSDVSKFDQSYGLFATGAVNDVTVNNVEYREYVVYSNLSYGRIYALTARLSDSLANRNQAYPTWQEPGSNRIYDGEVFFHEAENSTESNVITLSVETGKKSSVYQVFEGSVVRPLFNLATHQAAKAAYKPAVGAFVNFGSSFAYVKADGTFESSPLRMLNKKADGSRNHYFRYVICCDNEELLQEMALDTNVSGPRTNVTVGDVTNATVYTYNTGLNSISTENGSIFSKLSISTNPATTSGTTIVLKGDSIKVTVEQTGTVSYEDPRSSLRPRKAETITEAAFVVYDSSYKEITVAKAAEGYVWSGGGLMPSFSANIPFTNLSAGSMLFLRLTTDRSQGIAESGMDVTRYSDVFTGYTFADQAQNVVPVVQHVDLPIQMEFDELPLIGSSGFNFDFPFVSVSWEEVDDITRRLNIGVSPIQIVDAVKGTNMSDYKTDNGKEYSSMLDVLKSGHPAQTMKEGLSSAFKDVFNGFGPSNMGAAASLGGPTWKFDVQLGIYFDFVSAKITDPNNGAETSVFAFTGLGGFVGVSVGFKMTWYTLLPVVFIPAYFGIELDASFIGAFGAGTDTSKPKITYNDANAGTVNFDSVLGRFSTTLTLTGTVQIYVGIGLAGVIGLRGGGTFTAVGRYQPSTLEEISDWGADLAFTLNVWIDLVIYTVPLQYDFPHILFGSFEQYEELVREVSLQSAPESRSFTLRKPYSSRAPEWLPEEAALQSAFNETSSQTIVRDGYEHPDVQLANLSGGGVLMAFLDSDTTRGDADRSVLKYSVYRDGRWSDPVTVQEDGTADFQPSVAPMDDNQVLISWISRPEAGGEDQGAEDYLTTLEVYAAVIDAESGTVGQITRLTDDQYYDYTPTSVYDEVSGDMAVYFVKTATTGSAEEMANSYTNDCVLVYMLYSQPEGEAQARWLTDFYYDTEVSDSQERQTLIDNWHGQRFLPSPLPELGIDVPNIVDFTAISYNGAAVYAYTIDPDSSNDTEYDKELFVQFYDFETHKNYVPIRLTDDLVSDTLPQFVRTGSGETADTRLFWYRDGNSVVWIDISSLVAYGTDDDGHILESYLTTPDGIVGDLDSLYHYVSPALEGGQASRYMADYQALTDGQDVYVVWTQPAHLEDAEGNTVQCREVYATALIQNVGVTDTSVPEGEDVEKNGDGSEIGCNWSDAYRLTYTNAFTDEPSAILDAEGNLMVLYNAYQQELVADPDNPVKITDFQLKASYMEPCGSVDVTGIQFSDPTPNPGDVVTLQVDVRNTGLTYADGYTVQVFEEQGGALIDTIRWNGKLLPGNTDTHTLEWTAPASMDGLRLCAEAQEGNMQNVSSYLAEPLEEKAVYEFSDAYSWQDDAGYHFTYTVTNTGNAPAPSDDTVEILFTGPYSLEYEYEEEERIWAVVPFDGLAVDESRTYQADLDVIPGAFDRYGFVDCAALARNGEGDRISMTTGFRLTADSPISFLLNGEAFPETMTLSPGDTVDFRITSETGRFNDGMTVLLGTDNSEAAVFDGTTLKALSPGVATLQGVAMPYGTVLPEIQLLVLGEGASIGVVKAQDGQITADVVCEDTSAHVYCAVYDEMGRMITLRGLSVEAGKEQYAFDFTGVAFATAKVFLMDSENLPLCLSRSV